MMHQTPDWVRDAIFYQIFPDRFATSSAVKKPGNLEPWNAPPTLAGFKGGDLEGIRAQLGYLTDLGVTALYMTPIFASTANHRYHTYDYYQVDPILGGNGAFRRLLDAAHRRGMKVVLDGVFNHASRGFYQFNHTLENGRDSPYVDWFHFNRDWLAAGIPLNPYAHVGRVEHHPVHERSLNLYGYRSWWDIPALPKFNTDNPEVREFLLNVAEYWIDFGIDGWRLDVPNEIDDDGFWREFRRRVKAKNPEAYICGEIWGDASRWLAGDQFDGVMNYLLGKACLGFCMAGSLNHEQLSRCGYQDVRPLGAESFADALVSIWRRYPRAAAQCQLNLVGSHDTPRLMNAGLGDEAGAKLVFLSLFAVPGAPCIYYGDEIGMPGDHDPDNRRGFEWDEALWNRELRAHVRQCAQLRTESVALRRGDFHILKAAGGFVAWSRRHEGNEAIVCLNAEGREQNVEVPLAPGELRAGSFKAVLGGEGSVAAEQGTLRVKVPARSGLVLLGSIK